MSKILFINLGDFGSTGSIINGLVELAEQNGFKTVKCYPKVPVNYPPKSNDYLISSNFVRKANNCLGYLTGYEGAFAWNSTRKLINFIENEKPDIIHLNNIHSSFINLEILFSYLRKFPGKVIWTLHDCWAFTGRCPHFQITKCDKWRTGCYSCKYPRLSYPQSIFDQTKYQWKKKRRLFTSLNNLTIVTPSQWLADLARQSYMSKYDIRVIHNGINLDIFKPEPSNFRMKHNISEKCNILLGVSFGWNFRKGLDVFIELERRLNPSLYRIVLVGTNEKLDKELPKDLISIHRTSNKKELAEIYTAADLFVNPTREDNFPTVNIESLACGTPGVTFRTGGSPECFDEKSGAVVECGDIDALEKSIIQICEDRPFISSDCVERAKMFSNESTYQDYMRIYRGCLS